MTRKTPNRLDGCIFVVGVSCIVWAIAGILFFSALRMFSTGQFEIQIAGDSEQLTLTDSAGGSITQAKTFFGWARSNGTGVRIDGACLSACTIGLGFPNVCWSARAVFLFHRGHTPVISALGPDYDATGDMVRYIPEPVLDALPPWREWTVEYRPSQTLTGARVAELMGVETC